MKTKTSFKKIIILCFLLSAFVFFLPTGLAGESENYRQGAFFTNAGKTYLAVSNSSFVEILNVSAGNKLEKIGEIRGLPGVNDIYVDQTTAQTYLFVLTGQYLIKYNLTNVSVPRIEAKRDLYEWRGRDKVKIGYMQLLAGNKDYVFTAGTRGVRAYDIKTLAVQDSRIFTLEPGYGLAANGNTLAVIIKDKGFYEKGLVFDISTGALRVEYNLTNSTNTRRRPAIDSFGNIYFPSDNSLIKINSAGQLAASYYNPAKPGVIFSYGAQNLNSNIFYANGFGVTKLNNNLKSEKFFSSAAANIYGPNSWAVGVAVNSDGRVAILNKSSVLLLNNELGFLSQYHFLPINSGPVESALSIVPDRQWIRAGEKLNLKLYGFWPNETVIVKFGTSERSVTVDNYGAGAVNLTVPSQSGAMVVSANGLDSKLNYQVSFPIR